MKREYKIALSQEYYSDVVYLSQYDTDYDIEFTVLDKYAKATGIDGYTAKFTGTRCDGLGFTFESTASGETVSFEINTSLTAISGTHKGEIVFYDTDGLFFGSANVQIVVEPAARPDGTIDADVERAQSIAEQIQEIVDTAAEETTAEARQIVADVEDQLADVKEGLKSVDLVDRTAILFGYLNANGGEVYPNPAGANHEIMTDFIPVTANADYTMFWWGTLGGGYWHRLCWYDSEMNYISNSTHSTSQTTSGWFEKITDYTAPSNAAYVRVSVRSYDDGVFSFYTGRIKHAEKPNWYDFANAPHVTDAANVKSINHAGYSGTDGAPENTIPAFVQSKAHGFDFIECDTAVTKDGVVVCIHDNTIDRTSDGTGNVRDLTYQQLLQYDFGSWKSEEYAGTKIPKLEEVLDVCKALRLHPYIEIKYNGSFTRGEVEQIVDLVRSKSMLDSVTFISFSPQQLAWIKSEFKYARLGLLTNVAGDTTINFTDWAQIRRILQILRTGFNSVFADVRKETIDPTHTSYIAGINKLYDAHIPVECWTVYDTKYWFGRVDKCVNGFTTVTYNYDDWAEEQYGLEV